MKEGYRAREEAIEGFLSSISILEEYRMLSQLGRGSFSVVGLAVGRESNRRFAVKTYAKID
jgi:serine/threonine protein kinase